jgi:hypothetical protein
MQQSKVSFFVALAALSLAVTAPPAAAQAQCASLASAINQLRAQIPREPRDAAQADAQVLDNYVGLYNRACTGGGGGGVPRYNGGGNNPANALGAASNLLGALGNLLDEIDQQQREAEAEEAARQQEAELEAALEEAQRDAEARAQAAAARAAEAADQASRQAMANPFDQPASKDANPFDQPASKGANPFDQPAGAPRRDATGGSQGFKSDAQIKKECAQSGNPSMCALTEQSARSQDPAYRQYRAKQEKQLDKEIAQKQKAVDDAFKAFDKQRATRIPPDQLGALPNILAGMPPPNDDGLECGTRNGRRHDNQCFMPWSGTPEACAKELGGTYYPADDDHPTAFCANGAKPNPMTAWPGPHEGEQCGDAAGHIHGGACWALGITRDDCRDLLHGLTLDSGGYQYCAYDADQLAREEKAAEAASAAKKRRQGLADRLRQLMAQPGDDDNAQPGSPGPVAQAGPAAAPAQQAAAPAQDGGGAPGWTPHYTCRLKDGTVLGTDDPTTLPGFDPTHSFCRLDNSPALPGLTPGTGK